MRSALNAIYGASLFCACAAMAIIACLVLVQVGGRLLDTILVAFGGDRLGIAVPSLAEIGGYLFGSAAFLGLAPSLRSATHVRVTLALRALGPRADRVATGLVLVIALGLTVWALWAMALMGWASYQRGSLSYGMIPIKLWIPQGMMVAGLAVFAIAQLDELLSLILQGSARFRDIERNREVSAGGH